MNGEAAPQIVDFHDEESFRAQRRKWETAVRSDAEMVPTHRLVLLEVGSYASATSFAFPSCTTLAGNLGINARTVKRALKVGRQRGWLVPKGRPLAGTVRYAIGFRDEVLVRSETRREIVADRRRSKVTPVSPVK